MAGPAVEMRRQIVTRGFPVSTSRMTLMAACSLYSSSFWKRSYRVVEGDRTSITTRGSTVAIDLSSGLPHSTEMSGRRVPRWVITDWSEVRGRQGVPRSRLMQGRNSVYGYRIVARTGAGHRLDR